MSAGFSNHFCTLTNDSNNLERQPGKVYIVGSGPGHPELLTIKAERLLKAADVVVYDRLVQEEVLTLTRPSAERIYMGKPVGKHESRQAEIHELLVRRAHEGKMVVRLKGGDPFLFGRGGEEAEFLAGHGIPFEVVPGVSSALAAPLSAGIAVTHRELASAVTIVTGHEAKKEHSGLDWDALTRGGTLVFLMGVNNVAVIAQRLMEHGKDPDTPAAMIQMAFWRNERVVTATLATIAEEVRSADVQPPATLVVGEVVRLREKLKDSQRDLQQRPDDSPRFEPGPAPDQLLRLAAGGIGSQVLRLALALGVFDELDEFRQAGDLGGALDVRPEALGEILSNLVAMGLLEATPEGFRNLELASRYLKSDSPQSLKAAVLHLSDQSDCWQDLARYVFSGRGDSASDEDQLLLDEACECLARFAAPAVVDRLNLARRGPVLLLGWGGGAYREALARCSPGVHFNAVNIFQGQSLANGGRYGAVLLSGILASAKSGEVDRILATASGALNRGGLLAFHDSFLPSGVVPPPEATLGGLGRRISRGGCRDWSIERVRGTLEGLGLTNVCWEAFPAGTALVTASKM
jgi:uroporphyrin-III C-methyltransferase